LDSFREKDYLGEKISWAIWTWQTFLKINVE
jgi:hypothetical protein